MNKNRILHIKLLLYILLNLWTTHWHRNKDYYRAVFSSISISITIFFILNFLFPLHINIEYSTIIESDNGTVIHAFLTSGDKWRMKTKLDEITPELRQAIVYKEDKYFYYHFGINPVSIVRAAINNLIYQKRTSGASTITMQVARLLRPKERTYANKVVEIFRALQLELYYTKDEILQMYLNMVPYGGNIEGVKAASVLYFQKAPNHLSLAEITALSIIPNRPSSLRIGENNALIFQERNKWLKRFLADEVFDKETIEDALLEPLEARRHAAPHRAPHLAYRLKKKYTGQAILRTHLNQEMQRETEQLVKNYISKLSLYNINNAAVVVIDNKNSEVVVYVGSADFFNTTDAGQVDGVQAVRSPGSTLKPLIYGMAFETGLLTPKMTITDVPVNYGGYEPENYDGLFHGKVTIETALAKSLNIPAVKILDEVGSERFVNRLIKAGFEQIEKDRNQLGLSVILGGCGVTLEELTRLYAAFAHKGELQQLRFLKNDSTKKPIKILDEAAVFMLTEVLTEVERPDFPTHWQNSANLPPVAWKTGTSYGRRDAWSVGYNQNYTVGVWVGNFSAEGVQSMSGASTAAPLLFRIFNIVDYNLPDEWYSIPETVDWRMVCSESGLPPADFCKNTVTDYFIPGTSPNKLCTHLQEIKISADSSMAYCQTCLPASGYITALYPDYPPELLTYYNEQNINYKKIPPHNPDCERVFTTGAPVIVSPKEGLDYYIDKVDSTEIMLSCQTEGDVQKVFWYVNNQFHKAAKTTENLFIIPPPGRVKISCTDDKGRNTDIYVRIKYVRY